MNRKVLFFCSTVFFGSMHAQQTRLQATFTKKQSANEQKFEKYIQRNLGKYSLAEVAELKARLAGFAGEIPVYNQTDDTRANRSANLPIQGGSTGLNSAPITGEGMNILVMDGGRVFENHREFGADASGTVLTPRIFDRENGEAAYLNHSTNVAGIIGAVGFGDFSAPYGRAAAKGVLTKVNIDSYSFSTTSQGNNYVKLAAAVNANISNHSYGINLGWAYQTTPTAGYYWIANYELNHQDTYSGSYYTQDQQYDQIVYSNPNQIVVKSAGNYYGSGPDGIKPNFKYDNATGTYVPFATSDELPPANCSLGYNCIGWGSLAKNIIVVGATDQLTTANNLYSTATDVVKSSYSSTGPRKDGGIKPDISAVGTNMLVAGYSNDTTYNSYFTGSGTSFSAPVISGIAGALTQINRNLTGNQGFIYKADEMKALLTHTANEAGNPGPDVWYGWGFADAQKGAQLIIDKNTNKAVFERNALVSGISYTKEIYGKTGEALKATISWVDPAAVPFTRDTDLQNNHTSRLINDLDLRIIDTTDNTIYMPWKLDINNPMADALKGDNTVDNVEQVLIDAPTAGRKYRIEVTNKGTLVNDSGLPAPQNYALIITGYDTSALGTAASSLKEALIYPTRTRDFITVVLPEKGGSINVFDGSGKMVLNARAETNQIIDMAKLPAGVYLINITTKSGTVSKKIIKE